MARYANWKAVNPALFKKWKLFVYHLQTFAHNQWYAYLRLGAPVLWLPSWTTLQL